MPMAARRGCILAKGKADRRVTNTVVLHSLLFLEDEICRFRARRHDEFRHGIADMYCLVTYVREARGNRE